MNTPGKWANEIAADNNDSYTIRIPSDIKSGTYVLRTELIALHGNANQMTGGPLAGPQFYTYCFNVDVINGGSVRPEGVKFPGAYTREALTAPIYLPYKGDSAEAVSKGKELNSKYVRHPIFISANKTCLRSLSLTKYRFSPALPYTKANTTILQAHHQQSQKQELTRENSKSNMKQWPNDSLWQPEK
jgi:hypothetical protein